MMLQSKFLYAGHHRFSYGWDNPNCAAAVVVCLLPLIWCCYAEDFATSKSLRFVTLAIVECVTIWMLVLTYSRGAIIGLVGALLIYHLLPNFASVPGQERKKLRAKALLLRLALMAALLLASGLGRRMASVAEGDASALNRLPLWQGGLRLIAASPWRGWGRGSSGTGFTQWVQDPVLNSHYTGMVNSYLHVAVDFGLGGLVGLLFLFLFPIVFCLWCLKNRASPYSAIMLSSASGMGAFLIANIFTSLWMLPSVMWAPVLLMAVVLVCSQRRDGPGWAPAAISLGTALSLASLLWLTSIYVARMSEWNVKRLDGGAAEFVRRGTVSDGPSLCFLPDHRVLGADFGREIRSATQSAFESNCFVICPPGVRPRYLSGKTIYVVFGSRIQEIDDRMLRQTIIVFPSIGPALHSADTRPIKVILPQLDQVGFGRKWREWAQQCGCKVLTLPMTGQTLEGQLAHNWSALAKVESTRIP